MSDGGADRWDFFVSYTQVDQGWAEWVAWQLEDAGYRTLIQAWDSRAGDNWAAKMQEGIERADRTIAVLSPAYYGSKFGAVEWLAAWLRGPLGESRPLLVARVAAAERRGVLAQVVSFDLFDLTEDAARERLLAEIDRAVRGGRAKPSQPPRFPAGGATVSASAVRHDRSPTFPGGTGSERSDWLMLDRVPQRKELRAALTGRSGQIVIVSGPVGAGKSMLVDTVLHTLEAEGEIHVVYREALANIPLDVRTLTEAMEAYGNSPGSGAWLGGSSVARFESALGAARERPLAIVIESAENLLERSNRHLRDLDMDEAFEILATNHRHRVSVVLVTRAWPEAPSRSTWSAKARRIPVQDLPVPELSRYISRLDGRQPTGILDLPRDELEGFFRSLDGNPGNLSLAHTVVRRTDIGMDAATLAARLAERHARDIPRYLAALLVEDLRKIQHQVLNALVALGTPVDGEAVVTLLVDIPEPRILVTLDEFIKDGVLRLSEGRYYLPWPDVEEIVREQITATQSDLWHRAANVLRSRRTENPRNLDDLSMHFAMLGAFLHARFFPAAHRAIRDIDEILRGWNRTHLLFDQRLEVRGRLGDILLEMENEDALGHIFQFRRDFGQAVEAYHRALALAGEIAHERNKVRILVNLGSMHFLRHDIEEAEEYYTCAYSDAQRNGQSIVAMGALEGLAGCLRHRGQYDQAIAHLKDALSAWALVPLDTTDGRIGARRAVQCSLKLARWSGELGRLEEAERWLRSAHSTILAQDMQHLTGAYLDGQAEIHILRGDVPRALRLATNAVDEALRLNDPLVLLQARTTSCIAHLMNRSYKAAAAEIRQAHRYRLAERSLTVLGLLAVAERRQGDLRGAIQHFRELFDEADVRYTRDGEDFSAREFRGLAICGLYRDGGCDFGINDAIEDFRAARGMTRPPTPGLAGRLEFLLAQIDDTAVRPGELAPAIHACRG